MTAEQKLDPPRDGAFDALRAIAVFVNRGEIEGLTDEAVRALGRADEVCGGPEGEAGTAECEAPQSGGAEGGASPNPNPAIASKAEGR